jgi:hypothetical protein
MATKNFEALMTIVDKMSGPLGKMEEKLAAFAHMGEKAEKSVQAIKMTEMQKVMHHIGHDFHHMGERLHHAGERFRNFGEAAHKPLERVGRAVEKIVEAIPVLGTLGGLGSMAGIFEVVNRTSEAAEQLMNQAKIVGISTAALQHYDYAAKQSGVSIDTLTTGLERMNQNLGKAAQGRDKPLVSLLHHLNIPLHDANGHLRSMVEIMPQVQAALASIKDPTIRAADAQVLMGRAGSQLLPFLAMAPPKIKELNKQFDQFGYTLSGKDFTDLKKYHESMNGLESAVGGLITQLSVDFAPVLTPIIQKMEQWVSQNRKLISSDLKSDLKWLKNEIKSFPWAEFEAGASAALKLLLQGAVAAEKVINGIDYVMHGDKKFQAPLEHETMNSRFGPAFHPANLSHYETPPKPKAPPAPHPALVKAAMAAPAPPHLPVLDHPALRGMALHHAVLEAMPPPVPHDAAHAAPARAAPPHLAARAPLVDHSRASVQTIRNAVHGAVTVTADFKNLPRGTTVKVKGTGIAATPKTNKGYSSLAREAWEGI